MKHGQSFKTMAITINGNGTLTGVSVGGLPDGIVDADMLASNSVQTGKIVDDAVTDAKQDLNSAAKVWVCFNGTNTAIREHYGVSSITDEGQGDFSVNFSTSMTYNGYCAVYGSSNWETSNTDSYTVTSESNTSNRATSKINVRCLRQKTGFDFVDPPFVSVAIFGAQ